MRAERVEIRLSYGRKIAFTALCLALCVILPYAFHSVPTLANVFSPIHIPVLLCGFVCGWSYGLFCGVLGPVLCFLLTGMPSPIALPAMIAECIAYGVITSFTLKALRTGRFYLDVYASLIVAMIVGRALGGIVSACVFASSKTYTFTVWAAGYFLTSWPAIVLQLVLIPQILFALTKAKFMPERYERKRNQKEIDYFDDEK